MRVVLIPGFTQTPASWARVIEHLPDTYEPVPLTVPTDRSWVDTANALAAVGGEGTWVGYSMGGRLALQIAFDHPSLVEHLVLVSATAGIEEPAARAQRRAVDEVLADSIETEGIDRFLERWLARPMFGRVPADAPGLADRGTQDSTALAAALRNLGSGTMPDLWPRLSELAMPVTVVTGVHDEKFTAIGDRLAAACVNASVRRVEVEAGHAIPLELPDFLQAIL